MKGLPKADFDLSSVFATKPRTRKKGDRRYGSKTKKQKATAERIFQEELVRIKAIAVPLLEKESTLPKSMLFKTHGKKKLIQRLKEKLLGNQSPKA